MVFELDATLDPQLAPLAWLVGRWEGAGVIGYPSTESRNFGQEIEVSHDGRPFLQWRSQLWALGDQGERLEPLASEQGYWRAFEGGEVELLLAHPTGVVEMYFGTAGAGKIELRTDGVIRSPAATGYSVEYSAAHRLFGNVNSNLMWATDIAALGQPLTSHASAELKRVG